MTPPAPHGRHLLIELMGGQDLDRPDRLQDALIQAAEACGARVLSVHSHRFSPQGVTAVALLAESHITVHSWPEHGYAAFDVFLCGAAAPDRAVPVLRRFFSPDRIATQMISRGPVAEIEPKTDAPRAAQALGGIE